MKPYNKEDYEDVGIHCPTQEQFDQVARIKGDRYSPGSWQSYEKDIYILGDQNAYGNINQSGKGKRIIEAEDFILTHTLDEDNWCVKGPVDKDIIAEINKKKKTPFYTDWGGTDECYYGIKCGQRDGAEHKWGTVLTPEQVRKYIINKEQTTSNMKSRQIIGYKAPYDLGGYKNKGQLFKLTTSDIGKWYEWRNEEGDKSMRMPSEIAENWEAVFFQDSEETIIGKNNTKVKIYSNGKIEFRGEYTEINLVKALIKDFDIEPRPIGTSWKTKIDKSMRFIKIGCDSEDNRFSVNELELVVKIYEKLRN